jgi:hypothetical protein
VASALEGEETLVTARGPGPAGNGSKRAEVRQVTVAAVGRPTPVTVPRPAPPPPADAMSIVVRDTIDHARMIARDSVALGLLEVRRTAEDLAPRAAWGVVALAFGGAGAIILLVAIFIAAKVVIPSVAARLALLALLLLAIAAFGAWRATRERASRKGVSTSSDIDVRHVPTER